MNFKTFFQPARHIFLTDWVSFQNEWIMYICKGLLPQLHSSLNFSKVDYIISYYFDLFQNFCITVVMGSWIHVNWKFTLESNFLAFHGITFHFSSKLWNPIQAQIPIFLWFHVKSRKKKSPVFTQKSLKLGKIVIYAVQSSR